MSSKTVYGIVRPKFKREEELRKEKYKQVQESLGNLDKNREPKDTF